jgi:hypothetical protein
MKIKSNTHITNNRSRRNEGQLLNDRSNQRIDTIVIKRCYECGCTSAVYRYSAAAAAGKLAGTFSQMSAVRWSRSTIALSTKMRPREVEIGAPAEIR